MHINIHTVCIHIVSKNILVKYADLTAVWAEAWVVCAGQDKTPGGTWVGGHGTAGLSWDTDQGGSMTPVSEEKQENNTLNE